MTCTTREGVRMGTSFRPGLKAELAKVTNSWGQKRGWSGKAYSDVHLLPPESSPDIFKDRSLPALIALVDLLLSAGVSIEGNFCDIFYTGSGERILRALSGHHIYDNLGTPLNAVISGICNVERIVYEPQRVDDQDSLTAQLDYAFRGSDECGCQPRSKHLWPRHALRVRISPLGVYLAMAMRAIIPQWENVFVAAVSGCWLEFGSW
ncbi:hypothetical protein BOTBODRAFT_29188 [Botryobasidium botryosum FD-172 SS1]|uniref:Uncharacterized protein n=1 Tax=Botryobasidium botryosum (strain FD-172 SS1) TaxID=930990 RepID=A0A067N2B3_BOTB1|nr:hypothetical protein BOTBODRAFT_29188 [Botryobasidium botryosum FD-172 SS1]